MFDIRFITTDADGAEKPVGSPLAASSAELFDAIQLGRDVLAALGSLGLTGFKVANRETKSLAHEEWL